MDILCPHCSQKYTVDDSRAGQIVQCAVCGDEFAIPKPELIKPEPIVKPVIDINNPRRHKSLPQNKICPMCGETILYIAKKCRFCQTVLDDDMVQDILNTSRNITTSLRLDIICSIILSICGFIFFVVFLCAF
jgi:transcription elongation factor Elf1